MKKATKTGVPGQNGSYLAELFLENGYEAFRILKGNGFEMPNLKEANE